MLVPLDGAMVPNDETKNPSKVVGDTTDKLFSDVERYKIEHVIVVSPMKDF